MGRIWGIVLVSAFMVGGLSSISSATESVSLSSSMGDTIWAGQPFTINIGIHNDFKWGGMGLGFKFWSPDGANWTWKSQPNGYGSHKYVTVIPGSRMIPVASVWDFGFLITEQDVSGAGEDQILIGGVANSGGLPLGPMQDMMQFNLMVAAPPDDQVQMFCIDSAMIGAFHEYQWAMSDPYGAIINIIPDWASGGVCWPVKNPVHLPPVFTNCPSSPVNISHCGGSYYLDAADPEGHPVQFAIVSSDGAGSANINTTTGLLTYFPSMPSELGNTITIMVRVFDAYNTTGMTCAVPFKIINSTPTISCGANVAVLPGDVFTITSTSALDQDPCDTKSFFLVYVMPPFSTNPTINPATGVITGKMGAADVGYHVVMVGVTDGFDGSYATCSFSIDVCLCEWFEVTIEKMHNALQGHYVDLGIYQTKGTFYMGGYDFLLSYDASALTFIQAAAGTMFTNCEWEYFTFRLGPDGNCGDACPSGLVRIIALAETDNGPHHPIPGCTGTELAKMTFLVSNDRTLNCQFAPVKFFWTDCGDNAISTQAGDSLLISRYVTDYYGAGGVDTYTDITDTSYGFPGWNGAPGSCISTGGKTRVIRGVDLRNGGIDIICSDSIDAPGDINANGVINEIADAVMFTNYFITGLSAFGTHVESSIAASDVNADGTTLSVADLVYLIRVIVGDASSYSKSQPGASVSITVEGNAVTYTSPIDIGAAWLTFNISSSVVGPVLGDGAAGMDMLYGRQGRQLKVLVYNIGTKAISSGRHTLVTIPGDGLELVKAELADYNGNTVKAAITNLPKQYDLAQNVPNPFNPATKIAFTMPVSSDYSISIYNIAGQIIREYSGHADAGTIEVVWDGTDQNGSRVATGLYFYKASAAGYSGVKKMLLLK